MSGGPLSRPVGVVWGVIQAASPLVIWWLDPATVYALSLILIASVNRIAIGFRLLTRNLAIGFQMEQEQSRPEHIREPLAFRAQHVAGLGTFEQTDTEIVLHRSTLDEERRYDLSWTGCAIRAAA